MIDNAKDIVLRGIIPEWWLICTTNHTAATSFASNVQRTDSYNREVCTERIWAICAAVMGDHTGVAVGSYNK